MTLCKPEIVQFLSTEVVPCWESVGPVPRVTVDFGDGRILRRTLGGNIVLYLAAPDGRIIDAYPGVYTSADFLAEVRPGIDFLREHRMNPGSDEIMANHRAKVQETARAESLRTTLSKALVESPLLNALGARKPGTPLPAEQPEVAADYAAAFHNLTSRIQDLSKAPASAADLRKSLRLPADSRAGAIAVEMDSWNNRTLVRPAVHLYFAGLRNLPELNEIRDTLYRDILHIPVGDPYLGLAEILVPGTK